MTHLDLRTVLRGVYLPPLTSSRLCVQGSCWNCSSYCFLLQLCNLPLSLAYLPHFFLDLMCPGGSRKSPQDLGPRAVRVVITVVSLASLPFHPSLTHSPDTYLGLRLSLTVGWFIFRLLCILGCRQSFSSHWYPAKFHHRLSPPDSICTFTLTLRGLWSSPLN